MKCFMVSLRFLLLANLLVHHAVRAFEQIAPPRIIIYKHNYATRAVHSPLAFDGKKKRKPKNKKIPQNTRADTNPVQPGRVNQDSKLTMRQQIALVKAYKNMQKPTSPKTRVRFRRPKPSDADLAAAVAAKEVGDVSNATLSLALPLMFVDGYNIIGKWPRLRKRRDKNDLAGARQLLLDDLVEYNSPKSYDIVVVFDAADSTSDSIESYLGIAVVYSLSADGYIESEVRRIRAESNRKTFIATSDNQVRTACLSFGAQLMSAERFVQDLKGSRAAAPKLVDEWNRRNGRLGGRSGTLFDQLDEETKSMLNNAEYHERAPRVTRAERRALRKSLENESNRLDVVGGEVSNATFDIHDTDVQTL